MIITWTILLLIFIAVIAKYLTTSEENASNDGMKTPPGPYAFPIIGKRRRLYFLSAIYFEIQEFFLGGSPKKPSLKHQSYSMSTKIFNGNSVIPHLRSFWFCL